MSHRQGRSTNALYEIEKVGFGYRSGVRVLRELTATLRDARLTVLLGPNGCGKSTLLKLMLGVLRPASGEVRFAGEPLANYRDAERAARIAFVPQATSSGFFFTAGEVIRMGRFILDSDEEAFGRVVEDLGVEPLLDAVFVELSAGQQQRVLVARAFYQAAGRGRVVLLDEPVSAMDLYHVHGTLRKLRDFTRSGGAALVVLQDINLAAEYADDVWLMRGGELVRTGEWQEVLEPALLEEVYGVGIDSSSGPRASEDSPRPRFDVRWK